MSRFLVNRLCVGATILLASSTGAFAQDSHGDGGESGCGDLFGDLVEILRTPTTGVPLLEKRSVLLPEGVRADVYCPVGLYRDPVSGTAVEVPFVQDSCDFDTTTWTPTAVDYFGRLSAGRTKERNIRMHLDEVIEKIKGSEAVWRDVMGRIILGTGCKDLEKPSCATWTAIDSPVENLAIYQRLVKYGHLQTSPLEEDPWAKGGDSQATTQYHPALSRADWGKFVGETRQLLSTAGGCAGSTPLSSLGVDDPCFDPQVLESNDLVIASALLATAADKTGNATVDLVHYLNRIVKVTVATPHSEAPPVLLRPLYRVCSGAESAKTCELVGEVPTISSPPPTTGTDPWAPARERFIDFGAMAHDRAAVYRHAIALLRPADTLGLSHVSALQKMLSVESIEDVWVVDEEISILDFLAVRNPGLEGGKNIAGFVNATNDAIRTIEFVHNYRVPEKLTDFEFTSTAP